MNDVIDTIDRDGITVNILIDMFDHECPLEWSEGAVIFATFERESILTDMHPFDDPAEALQWSKDNKWLCMPLFKYEHGLVQYATSGFSCPWDSWQAGYILVNPAECPDPAKYAASVCESVTDWCNGSVYCYEVTYSDGETGDTLGGIYGYEYAQQEAEKALRHACDTAHQQDNDRMAALMAACPVGRRATYAGYA